MKKTMKGPTKNIRIQANARGLSAQAGMISVLTFLNHHQIYKQLSAKLDLNRAKNAHWQLADAAYLTTTAVIAGAKALSGVKSVWSDPVLREIDNWESIPSDTTLSRVFKECNNSEILALQDLIHDQGHTIFKKMLSLNKMISEKV